MCNFKMYISLPPTDVSCRKISLRLVPIFGGGFGTSKSVGMATVVRDFFVLSANISSSKWSLHKRAFLFKSSASRLRKSILLQLIIHLLDLFKFGQCENEIETKHSWKNVLVEKVIILTN